MKCPLDGSTLVMSERSGIEIDYCPECRGVWLDRGELDKMIDRASAEAAGTSQRAASAPQGPPMRAPLQAPPLPAPSLGSDRFNDGFDDRRRREDSRAYGASRDDRTRDFGRGYDKSRRRKKDSFLGDLFDF